MKLNHANLCTTDVAGLAGFFAHFFDFKLVAMRGREAFAVLEGTDGFALNLMKPIKAGTAGYPDGFHIGFFVDGSEVVHRKHAELLAAGHAPGDIQQLNRGGTASTTFYCDAPGSILVEVSAYTG